MHFFSESLENYISQHAEEEFEYLQALRAETHRKVIQPRMISGHYQGRLLSFISKLVKPHRILEIGTYTGYSALCLAEGLGDEGRLDTIEINEELIHMHQKHLHQSQYANQIRVLYGDALKVLPQLKESYDLVFIDAKKALYNSYLDLVLPLMSKNGLLLADNILWSGKVVEEVADNDKATNELLAFNKRLHEDTNFESIILPVRDGLSLHRKRND